MDAAASDSKETRDLLQRASEGDGDACERLLARHRPELHAFVELRLDARLRTRLDASDVVQEAQLEALRRFPDYVKRRPMPFRHWLRKTAYERLLMLRRRHLNAARGPWPANRRCPTAPRWPWLSICSPKGPRPVNNWPRRNWLAASRTPWPSYPKATATCC